MVVQHRAYIALGSNLGDRRAYLEQAIAALTEIPEIEVVAQSRFIETVPVGPGKQNHYLNAALEISTEFTPNRLLEALLRIERKLGRIRNEKWGPRTIDLDILFYDDLIVDEPKLRIPHPHLQEREFVLEPLCDIAPTLEHPASKHTMSELLAHLRSTSAPKKVAESK